MEYVTSDNYKVRLACPVCLGRVAIIGQVDEHKEFACTNFNHCTWEGIDPIVTCPISADGGYECVEIAPSRFNTNCYKCKRPASVGKPVKHYICSFCLKKEQEEEKAYYKLKNEEKIVNEKGGIQGKQEYYFDWIPPEAMFRMSKIFYAAAVQYGYPFNNWRKIPAQDHLRHLLKHIFAQMRGDTDEDHIGHALCRMVFWTTMAEIEEKQNDSF